MKKLYMIVAALAVTFLVGCGSKVEVPPAHVGKILTKNGYAPDTVPPSKFRLPKCFAYCDKLVLLQAGDTPFKEPLTVFMPDDKLNLTLDVRGTFNIPTTPQYINGIYSKISAGQTPDANISLITASTVYKTYGQPALRGIVRNEIVKYRIAEILSQREAIAQNIHTAIQEKMASNNTPMIVSRFELADVQPPKVIVDAQEAAKEREIDIQKAQADAEVKMTEAKLALEIAKKDRLVEREKAEAIAEQNKIAADSITPQLLAYKKLETAENIYSKLAESDNVIIIPADSAGFSNITDDAVLAKMLGQEWHKGTK